MKKTSILLAFLACSTILVTCVSVNHAKAHPMSFFGFPTEPNYSQPSIVIHSPVQNGTFNNSTDLNLNLTIIKPDDFRGSVVSAYYTLTNRTSKQVVYINLHDNQTRYGAIQVLNYSSQLGSLGPGEYTLKINLEIESYYEEFISGMFNYAQKSVMVNAESEPVTFTISPPPTPTPAPTETPTPQTQNQPALNPTDYMLPLIAITAGLVIPTLLYRSHRKTVKTGKE